MAKYFLGWIFIVLAIGQVFLAIYIFKINNNKNIENNTRVSTKYKNLNKVSRFLQVSALLVFLVYLFFGGVK